MPVCWQCSGTYTPAASCVEAHYPEAYHFETYDSETYYSEAYFPETWEVGGVIPFGQLFRFSHRFCTHSMPSEIRALVGSSEPPLSPILLSTISVVFIGIILKQTQCWTESLPFLNTYRCRHASVTSITSTWSQRARDVRW